MKRYWLIVPFLVLASCTSDGVFSSRSPASMIVGCNRQSLGEPLRENIPLVDFNGKRIEALSQLLITQIQHLRNLSSTDPTIKDRLQKLEAANVRLKSADIKSWDEPNDVSWKLNRSLEIYLKDMAIDESSNQLSNKEKENLKYVKETIAPNLSTVSFWVPDFCKKISGNEPIQVFKGL